MVKEEVNTANGQESPTSNENVAVLFQMPGGDRIWWEAHINNIAVVTATHTKVRAVANVTYTAGKDNDGNTYKSENGCIHFRQGRSVLLIAASGTISQGAQSSWKYQNELERNDRLMFFNRFCYSSKSRGVRNQVVTRPNIEQNITPQQLSHVPDDGPSSRTHRRSSHPNCSNKKLKTTESNLPVRVNIRKRVKQTDQPSMLQHERARSPTKIHSNNNKTSDSIETLHAMYTRLDKEIATLNAKINLMENEKNSASFDKKSLEKRMFMKYELKRLTKRSPVELRGEVGSIFSSMFRRCPL